MSKVSILVAVFNSARFLPQCLDSLLAQTYRDIEVICIDDASTDSSLSILNDYARRDVRVHVLHLSENVGQAAARNAGLKLCTGELVGYLDSDDWMSADCIEHVVSTFTEHPATDCVLLDVKIFDEQHGTYRDYSMEPFELKTGIEAFEDSLDWRIHGVYVGRRALFASMPYDTTCRRFSDDNTTRLHYYRSHEVRRCAGIYYYRLHPASASQRKDAGYFDFLRANESMKSQLETLEADDRILRLYECQRMLVLVDCYQVYHRYSGTFSPSERRHAIQELHRVWKGIDSRLLDSPQVRKFGYRKLPWWWLFRVQEWCYFTARGLIKR